MSPSITDCALQAVNRGDESDKEKFLKNVDKFVSDNAVLERFFKDKKDFVREIAQKAANLKEDPETDLGDNDTLPKTVKVSLHQQVIYCGKRSLVSSPIISKYSAKHASSREVVHTNGLQTIVPP